MAGMGTARRLTAIIEPEEGGYVALCPELSAAVPQGPYRSFPAGLAVIVAGACHLGIG
jgi:hypothetical protein